MGALSSRVESILFVGLGAMGTPMAKLLGDAGYRLSVYDIDPACGASLEKETRCTAVEDLSSFVDPVDLLILMLPTSSDVESVLLGGDRGGLLKRLSSSTAILDMSSSDPNRTVVVAEIAGAAGLEMSDAPVSGGVARAITGELSIMFGGSDTAFDLCRPVLDHLGSSIARTGPVGSGHAMKALNNLLSAMGIVAASEVLGIGARFGLDPDMMVEVLNHSTGRNHATEIKFPRHILTRTFDSGFSLRLMVKDLTTALGLSHQLKATAPMAAACFEAFLGSDKMLDNPAADHTEVAKYVERNIGVTLESHSSD